MSEKISPLDKMKNQLIKLVACVGFGLNVGLLAGGGQNQIIPFTILGVFICGTAFALYVHRTIADYFEEIKGEKEEKQNG